MTTEQIRISLTTFVKFALAMTTGKRVGIVDEAKEYYEDDYDPAKDYWRPLRKAIVKMHENGSESSDLDAFLLTANGKKLPNYRPCARAYKKWMGKKNIEWIGGPGGTWTHGVLTVKVNPELVIRLNGEVHVIKLHFGEKVSKRRVDTMLYLVETTLPAGFHATVAILDVPRGRLVTRTREVPHIERFLRSEAAAFLQLWEPAR